MIWVLFTVVAVLLVGVFAGMLTGRIGYDPLSEPVSSQPDPGLGEEFTATTISDVRFDTALRGYRMDQVDQVLDALQDRIAEQERELAELRRSPELRRDSGLGQDSGLRQDPALSPETGPRQDVAPERDA